MKRLLVLLIAIIPLIAVAQQNRNRGNNGQGRGGNGNYNNGYGNQYYQNVETGSALTIFSGTGERFYLLINGIKQNRFAQSRIRVENLPYAENDIQIIFDDNYTPAINRRIYLADPIEGRAISLTLALVRERGQYPRISFFKSIPLDRDYRSQQGEYVMQYGVDVNPNQPVQVYNNVPPPPPAPTVIDQVTFASAKRTIAACSFDDTKMSTAKTVISNNYFTTDQVMELCKLFTWDDNRLAIAKYAYYRTIDQNNYFKVSNVFTWDDNRRKLNDFISNGGR